MTQGRDRQMIRWITAAIVLLCGVPASRPNADLLPNVEAAAKESTKDLTPQTLQTYFQALSDDDPAHREEARAKLMSISRKDLPALRDVVKARRPLTPAEAEELREIVTQVYLSESDYPSNSGKGFLGVTSYTAALDDPMFDLECGGVEIAQRIPGTCSYRYLEDGDVVLAVASAQFQAKVARWTDMSDVIVRCTAGQTVVLRVLRRGRILDVPIVLSAKPLELEVEGIGALSGFVARRRAEADGYWEETFEPLIAESARP